MSLLNSAQARIKGKTESVQESVLPWVQLWKTIPVDVQMSARKTDFKRGIKHVLLKYDL